MFMLVWPTDFDDVAPTSFVQSSQCWAGYSWASRGGTTLTLLENYLDEFARNGVPVNACTFANRETSARTHQQVVRFDHHGGLVKHLDWGEALEMELWAKKLMVYSMPVERLNQVAWVLTGPEFTLDQREYGKRHILTRMLTE